MPVPFANYTNPVPGGEYGRIDQGVDYVTKSPVVAVTQGTIEAIYHDMAAANTTRIVERFDKPIYVNGHEYFGAYYSEENSRVKVGQKVKTGQQVMDAGSNEIGFLVGQQLQMPPLVGGLGAGTQPSVAGEDFNKLVVSTGGPGKALSGGTGLSGVGSAIAHPIRSAQQAASGVFSGVFGGIEAFLYQGLFVIIGLGLLLVGLGLVAWTLMGRVGAPGIIGMAQQQMRINQATARIEESQRASMTRESQASERIAGQREQRQLSAKRLEVQERHLSRRESEPTNVIYPVQERVTRNRGKYA